MRSMLLFCFTLLLSAHNAYSQSECPSPTSTHSVSEMLPEGCRKGNLLQAPEGQKVCDCTEPGESYYIKESAKVNATPPASSVVERCYTACKTCRGPLAQNCTSCYRGTVSSDSGECEDFDYAVELISLHSIKRQDQSNRDEIVLTVSSDGEGNKHYKCGRYRMEQGAIKNFQKTKIRCKKKVTFNLEEKDPLRNEDTTQEIWCNGTTGYKQVVLIPNTPLLEWGRLQNLTENVMLQVSGGGKDFVKIMAVAKSYIGKTIDEKEGLYHLHYNVVPNKGSESLSIPLVNSTKEEDDCDYVKALYLQSSIFSLVILFSLFLL